MSKAGKMSFEVSVAAPATAVYRAMTSQAELTQWLCNTAQVTAQEGGVLFLHWNRPNYYAVGEFTKLKPARKISFTWYGREEPAATRVKVRLTEVDGATRVKLTHRGLGAGEEWDHMRQQVASGWETSLANLKQVLETGLDRRIYDRPFVGVFIAGQVSAAEMKTLGLDAAGGIRISGTVAESAAAAAGLQPDDIVVAIGDHEVGSFGDWQSAMAPVKTGDTVAMGLFRAGERQSVEVTLTARPAPNVTTDPALLAEQLHGLYEPLIAELNEIVADATEAEANYAAEGQWSAKEILAHLLTTERGMHMSIASNIDGQLLLGWANNPRPWMTAYADSHTLETLAIAYQQSLDESVAILAHLPEDLVARKSTYLGIAQTMINLVGHIRGHFDEMRQAIAVGREAAETEAAG